MNPNISFIHHCEEEQIDVLRIRLWDAKRATAVLSDFCSTERVLAQWAQSSGCGAVHFEVRFVDGYVLEGDHEFHSKGKRRCTLGTHLRRMMKHMADAEDFAHLPPARDASRYMIPTN